MTAGQSTRRSYLARHWRGELPLWLSVVNALLAMFLPYLALNIYADLPTGRAARLYYAGMVAGWFTTSLFAMLALVGLWRAARRPLGGAVARAWGFTVQLCAAAGMAFVVLLGLVLSPGLGCLAELVADPLLEGGFELRVLEDGTELEFSGRVAYGAAAALADALQANPGVRVLHLESPGGVLTEGYRMATAIRDRRLVTHVARGCSSACVVAYAAGEERWLAPAGRLGLHAPRNACSPVPADDTAASDYVDYLVERGVARAFAERGLTTPANQIWNPGAAELLAAGLVTRVR
jgi:hypothetical protein